MGPHVTKRPVTRAHTTCDGMLSNWVFRVKTVKNCMVTAGVEPAIPCMGGRSAHHHATVAAAGIHSVLMRLYLLDQFPL